jgi:hypothetical protein
MKGFHMSKMSSANIETGDTSKPTQPTAPGTAYTVNGESAVYVRDATSADMGYREGGGDQILVQFEDGHQEVVSKSVAEGNDPAKSGSFSRAPSKPDEPHNRDREENHRRK